MADKKRKPKPRAEEPAPKSFTPEEVKDIRDALGLTQAEAAARLGLSRRTWQDYERGIIAVTPPIALLISLLKAGKI